MNEELEKILNRIQNEEDPFTKAKLIYSIKLDKQVTLRVLSAKIKLKPSYVSHILRLLKLPPLIVDGYYSQLTTLSHLFILSRLHDEKEMISLYEKILSENLTSLQTEELVREKLYSVKSGGSRLEKKEIDDFLSSMNAGERKVKIIQSRTKGKLILEIDGDLIKTSEELRKIMELLKPVKYGDTQK